MQYALAMVIGGDETQRWPIAVDEVTIGRSDKATVVVDGGTVSRQHARLWLEDGIVAVEDLGSRNGVKINGVRTRSGSLH
ncbi:MAG: FHA domain-containing protein, partial [Candidatus Hydrogenedentota bacterium]